MRIPDLTKKEEEEKEGLNSLSFPAMKKKVRQTDPNA